MKIDVERLEITPDEFQKITGKTRENLNNLSFFRRRNQAICNLKDYLLYICWMHKIKEGQILLEWFYLIMIFILVMIVGVPLYIGLVHSYHNEAIPLNEIKFKPFAITAIILTMLFRFVAVLYAKNEYKTCRLLMSLVEDIENYNKIVAEIKVCENFIELARTQGRMIDERERRLIDEAINMTKEDLIAALKIDRFIRENSDFMSRHPDLLRKSNQNNLNALQSLKIEDETSTYQRWIDELLKIAVRVQEKMSSLRECKN